MQVTVQNATHQPHYPPHYPLRTIALHSSRSTHSAQAPTDSSATRTEEPGTDATCSRARFGATGYDVGTACKKAGQALGHPPPNPSPPPCHAGSSPRTIHHHPPTLHPTPPPPPMHPSPGDPRTAARESTAAPSEPYLPSVPPAQAHHRATDADLLRSGELVDEPGPGAGPRRAYPSLHHVRPASMLRVPCSWCVCSWCVGVTSHQLGSACWLLAAPMCSGRAAEPRRASGRTRRLAADFAAFNTHRPVQHGGVRLCRRVKVPSWWIVRSCCASSGKRLAAMSAAWHAQGWWHAQGKISHGDVVSCAIKARLELAAIALTLQASSQPVVTASHRVQFATMRRS